MKEWVVISGKGGTGKTSLTASFAVLAGNAVLVDCDVDAADLHLVLSPAIKHHEDFTGGHEAEIRQQDCIRCGACLAHCRFDAVSMGPGRAGEAPFTIDSTACEGCGVCVRLCPVKAIDFPERLAGEWYESETRCGPMVHARLKPGGENSGKLVSRVREAARRIATDIRRDLILIDGPPGVGCSAIASLTGAALALIVTEPTLSGSHDMGRVIELTAHFDIPTVLCVNKWDLNPDQTEQIERDALKKNVRAVGRIRYDRAITQAQIQGKAVVEITEAGAGKDIRAVWTRLAAFQA